MTKNLPENTTPIAFKAVEEFQARPNYVLDLRCEKNGLDRIIGKYEFSEKEKLQCGLNGCNKWHWHGYVIRTKDGREGHCGRDCGRREFGVTFEEVEAVYKRAEDAEAKREQLRKFTTDRDALLTEATKLAEMVGAAAGQMQSILSEIGKEGALERAFEICVRDGGRILAEDENSKRLRAAMGAASGKADLKVIGSIKGVSAVGVYAVITRELRYLVIEPLLSLAKENLEALTIKELDTKASQFGQFRQITMKARQFVSDVEQFASESNLRALSLLQDTIPKKAKTARLMRILDRIPAQFSTNIAA